MATALSNLSSYDPTAVPNGKGKRVGIVVADWNPSVTHSLLNGATDTLLKFGLSADDIIIEHVPGSFELTYAAKIMIEKAKVDSVIIIGCVIQGDTPHFTFVCDSVTAGATQLNLQCNVPVIFGVLTTLTLEQALDRAGGKHGNKGDEAAITALKMMELQSRYE